MPTAVLGGIIVMSFVGQPSTFAAAQSPVNHGGFLSATATQITQATTTPTPTVASATATPTRGSIQIATATPTDAASNPRGLLDPTPTPIRSATPTTDPALFQPLLLTGSPTPTVSGTGRIVGSGGYVTITQALAAAAPGDTIRVKAGRYPEAVNIRKTVTLTAYGDGPVWIDGECLRPNAVSINANDVVVRGIGVKRTLGAGIMIDGRNGVVSQRATIEGDTVQDYNCDDVGLQNQAGIAAWYAGAGHHVVGNTITRRVEVPGSQRGYGDGIWFKSNSDHPSGGGHVITDNTIVGGRDGIGGETEGDVHGSFDRDTVIARNVVRNCADDGIQVEGGDVNVQVTDNRVEECGVGIAFAPNLLGPLTIENNTIVSSTPGALGVLACFKIGDGGTGTAYITGNVCHIDGTSSGIGGDGIQQTNTGLATYVTRNNTFDVSRYVMELTGKPRVGSSFDLDCLSTSDSTRFIKWAGVRYGTLAQFRQAAHQEMKGSLPPC